MTTGGFAFQRRLRSAKRFPFHLTSSRSGYQVERRRRLSTFRHEGSLETQPAAVQRSSSASEGEIWKMDPVILCVSHTDQTYDNSCLQAPKLTF